jgi:hypothetical protein
MRVPSAAIGLLRVLASSPPAAARELILDADLAGGWTSNANRAFGSADAVAASTASARISVGMGWPVGFDGWAYADAGYSGVYLAGGLPLTLHRPRADAGLLWLLTEALVMHAGVSGELRMASDGGREGGDVVAALSAHARLGPRLGVFAMAYRTQVFARDAYFASDRAGGSVLLEFSPWPGAWLMGV